jgi:hypothetical protein
VEHFRGAGYNYTPPRIAATTDGDGVVSLACPPDFADRATSTESSARRLAVLLVLRKRPPRHDLGPGTGRHGVAVADGATTISDVTVLADQAALFGSAASDSTWWRLPERGDRPGGSYGPPQGGVRPYGCTR